MYVVDDSSRSRDLINIPTPKHDFVEDEERDIYCYSQISTGTFGMSSLFFLPHKINRIRFKKMIAVSNYTIIAIIHIYIRQPHRSHRDANIRCLAIDQNLTA